MAKPKRRTCRASGCTEDPYLGGLCCRHHDEDERKRRLRQDALDALFHATIDGRLPDDPMLRSELSRLRIWWDRACDSVNYRRETTEMPLEEAQFAVEWCIALAQEIVEAERAIRVGQSPRSSLHGTRHWVWERLGFLEAGLRSNGLPRRSATNRREAERLKR